MMGLLTRLRKLCDFKDRATAAPRIRTGAHLLGIAGLVLCLACGGASSLNAPGHAQGGRDRRAIELGLRRPDGDWIHLGDLRGQPLFVFLFATFDGVSQASLRPLSRFRRTHDDVHMVGIAAQPDANQLLDPYERALQPPFPLTYDPQHDVHHGTSVLGRIEQIPTLIVYDENGFEVERYVGFPSERTLERLYDEAR